MKKIINRKAEVTYKVTFDDYVEFEFEGLLFDIDNVSKQLEKQFLDAIKPEFEKNDIDIIDFKLIKFIDYQQPIVDDQGVRIKIKSLEIQLTIDPKGKKIEISDAIIKDEDLFTQGVTAVIVIAGIVATAIFGWLTVREVKLTVEKVKLLDPDQLAFLEQLMTKGSIGLLLIAFIVWIIWKWFKGGGKD